MKFCFIYTLLLFSCPIIGQNFHTEFKYNDGANKGITIQNSYPKGGKKFVGTDGNEFVYVTFWTCITNDTSSPLELGIDFTATSFVIPSEPDINFNLFVPHNEMSPEKITLLNYGLDVPNFLIENIYKPTSLRAIIEPHHSYRFYTVVISSKGVKGTIRAGFELQEKELIYNINNYEINCGKIKLK